MAAGSIWQQLQTIHISDLMSANSDNLQSEFKHL
jgi:hypothetical protein